MSTRYPLFRAHEPLTHRLLQVIKSERRCLQSLTLLPFQGQSHSTPKPHRRSALIRGRQTRPCLLVFKGIEIKKKKKRQSEIISPQSPPHYITASVNTGCQEETNAEQIQPVSAPSGARTLFPDL